MLTKINSDLAIWWHIHVKKCQYCYWRLYHSLLCLMSVMVGPDRAAENFCAVFSLISFPKIYSSSYPAFATWFDVCAKHCGAGGLTKKNSYSVQNPFNRSKVYISRKYGFYSLSPLFFVLLRKNAWKLGDCRVLLSTLLWHFMAWSMTRCELSSWKDRYYRANMSWGIEKKNDRKTSSRNIAPLKWRLFLFPAKCQKKKKMCQRNGAVLPLSLIKFQHPHN